MRNTLGKVIDGTYGFPLSYCLEDNKESLLVKVNGSDGLGYLLMTDSEGPMKGTKLIMRTTLNQNDAPKKKSKRQ